MKKILFLLVLIGFSSLFAQTPMNLLANWDDNALPTKSGLSYNDCWGYAAANNREYAILGSLTKIHFFEIDATTSAVSTAATFTPGANSIWRDFKTYSHFAYAVADEGLEGLLVFDLANINGTSNRVTQIHQDVSVFDRCHNIYLDEANRKLYCAGSRKVVSGSNVQHPGVLVYDLDATTGIPTLCGSIPFNSNGISDGYIHDIHVKNGKLYCSHGYNGMRIYDGTTLNNWQPGNAIITSLPYLGGVNPVNSGYNHSSWLNSTGTHLIMASETHGQPLRLLDLNDFSNIYNFQSCMLCPTANTPIVHNPFVKGNLVFLSYYHEGVQVFDIGNPSAITKATFYDTEPSNTNYAGYTGSWGVYPFLPSQKVIASDVNNGLFVLQLPSALLPVRLSDFKATRKNEIVFLDWKTEIINEKTVFEVQKSKNAIDFETIALFDNKEKKSNFTLRDENPFKGKNFYRLKIIDKDQSFEFSKMVEIDFFEKNHATIYPNPSENGTINIDFGKNDFEKIEIEISDLQGRLVEKIDKNDISSITINNLPKGSFIIKINTGKNIQAEKILIK